MRRLLQFGVVLTALAARGEIIDRIAVSVGNQVITASDLDREIRVTAFLNGAKLDLSPTVKRATAERMVEQKLVRQEIQSSRYPEVSAADVVPALDQFKKQNFPSEEAYQQTLRAYRVADKDVIGALLWQRTMLQFVELRFGPGVQVSDEQIRDYFEKVVAPAAKAAHPDEPVALEDLRGKIEQTLAGKQTDEQIDNWLKNSRQRTTISFHDEVLR